jgi:hypothetical protein
MMMSTVHFLLKVTTQALGQVQCVQMFCPKMKGAISSWSLGADNKIDPVDLIKIAEDTTH